LSCGKTWTIRPKRRGPKPRRATSRLAIKVLQTSLSLRGLATNLKINREKLRRRFGRSLEVWSKTQAEIKWPKTGPLIMVADALWFNFNNQRYTCFVILLRPVDKLQATLAILKLKPGRECEATWSTLIEELPHSVLKRTQALVGDGSAGLLSVARSYDWEFQRCHFHLKLRMAELRGLRNIPGKLIRQEVQRQLFRFLEVPSPLEAKASLIKIKKLFARPDCPHTLPSRLAGLFKHSAEFRAYRLRPELNLPVTSNSAECVARQIRDRLHRMRGVRSPESLAKWLKIIHQQFRQIKCQGWRQTLQN
jgi:hypothetical protein